MFLLFDRETKQQKTNHANNVFKSNQFFKLVSMQVKINQIHLSNSHTGRLQHLSPTNDTFQRWQHPLIEYSCCCCSFIRSLIIINAKWSFENCTVFGFWILLNVRHSLETFLMKKWSIMNVTPEIANLKRTTHRYIWWVMESCLIMFAFEFHCYFCCWKFFGRHLRSKHKHLNRNFYLCNIIFFCYYFISMDFLVLPSFFGDFDQIFNQNTQKTTFCREKLVNFWFGKLYTFFDTIWININNVDVVNFYYYD